MINFKHSEETDVLSEIAAPDEYCLSGERFSVLNNDPVRGHVKAEVDSFSTGNIFAGIKYLKTVRWVPEINSLMDMIFSGSEHFIVCLTGFLFCIPEKETGSAPAAGRQTQKSIWHTLEISQSISESLSGCIENGIRKSSFLFLSVKHFISMDKCRTGTCR